MRNVSGRELHLGARSTDTVAKLMCAQACFLSCANKIVFDTLSVHTQVWDCNVYVSAVFLGSGSEGSQNCETPSWRRPP